MDLLSLKPVRRAGFMAWMLACVLLTVPAASALDTGAVPPAADDEKRSSIHEVDGYASLSEDMTLSQTRAAAMANARRQAVEMAATRIRSRTRVENFVIEQDVIQGTAEGAVTVLELRDLGVEDNRRYHVWIRAEVEYSMKPDGGGDSCGIMDPAAPLTVRVWTPRKSYHAGESIEICIEGNRDFYGRIVDITAGGRVVQLLINDYRDDNFFRAGKRYRIPDADDRFDLTVAPPFGEDRIVVYASEAPLGDVEGMKSAPGGLRLYTGSPAGLAAQTRGITVTGRGGAEDGAEFYEAAWKVTTSR